MDDRPSGSRLLLTEICVFVSETVKGYPFPDPSGKWRDCRVFLHGLPEEQEAETYPFVVIRWAGGDVQSDEDSKTVLRDAVALILGAHAPRSQAEAGLLCAEFLDCLRRALWKKRLLAKRFELVEPLRASMPDMQKRVHRFHLATIETVWDYIWPPKALEEAGQNQLKAGNSRLDSYSAPILRAEKIQS